MGRRRRSSVASGLDAFAKAYSMTKGVMDDYDRKQVADSMKEGMVASRAEAEASGGTDYTLDRGLDSTAPDYSYKDKASRDANAAAMESAASMQAEIDAEKTGAAGLQPPAAAAPPASAMQAAITPVQPAPRSATAAMQEALNPASAQPGLQSAAPAPAAAPNKPMTPQEFYAQGEINKPKLDAMDIFHKKYAPAVAAKLMEQGKVDEAAKFEDWTRSAQGKAYGTSWLKATQLEAAGDHNGAMTAVQDLYNKQLPDGKYATAIPGQDGTYSIQVRDEKTNQVVQQFAGKAPDLTQALLGMGSPDKVWSHLTALQAKQVEKQDKLAAEERKFGRDKELEGIKAGKTTPTELEKLMRARDGLPEGSRDRALVEQKIKLLTTREPAATTVINMGSTPQEMAGGGQGVVVTDKGKRTSGLVPLKGAPNAVDEAYNALDGITYAKPPGGVAKMYMRDGVPLSKAEREQAMKYHDTLRRNKRQAPWEQPPGLK